MGGFVPHDTDADDPRINTDIDYYCSKCCQEDEQTHDDAAETAVLVDKQTALVNNNGADDLSPFQILATRNY
jgi:hypothetical protein